MELYKCVGLVYEGFIYQYGGKGITLEHKVMHILHGYKDTLLCSDIDFKQYFKPIKEISKIERIK